MTFAKWCEEANAALGNAIVPQVALEILSALRQSEFGKGLQ